MTEALAAKLSRAERREAAAWLRDFINDFDAEWPELREDTKNLRTASAELLRLLEKP